MPIFSRSSGSDRGPRRRRGDRDDAARLAFEVEEFEFVPAGDAGLLRLSGRWSAKPEQTAPVPIEIEIERDGEAVRLEVVPDPSAPTALATPEGEPWRGAFMVATELAEDARADFALVADGEVVAGLPRPGDWEVLTNGAPEDGDAGLPGAEAELFEESADGSGVLPELLAALEDVAEMADAAAGPDAVVPLEIPADDLVAEHVAAREAAERRADGAAEALERAAAVETLQRAELDAARTELSEAREAAAAELTREREAREQAEAAAEQARADVATERTGREHAEALLDQARAEIATEREARTHAETAAEAATTQASAAHAAREQAEAALAEERTAREHAEASLTSALTELERQRYAHEHVDADLAEARAALEAGAAERDRERARHEQERTDRDAALDALGAELERERANHETAVETQRAEHEATLEALRAELEAERAAGADERDRVVEELRAELETERAERERERNELAAELHRERGERDRERTELASALEAVEAELDSVRANAAAADGAGRAVDERAAEEAARKLAALNEHLDQARQDLEIERRRRLTIEEELRIQIAVERQLRNSLAGHEAELASVEAHVARRVRAAEHRRVVEERGEADKAHNVADDFIARLEQAKRLSETT